MSGRGGVVTPPPPASGGCDVSVRSVGVPATAEPCSPKVGSAPGVEQVCLDRPLRHVDDVRARCHMGRGLSQLPLPVGAFSFEIAKRRLGERGGGGDVERSVDGGVHREPDAVTRLSSEAADGPADIVESERRGGRSRSGSGAGGDGARSSEEDWGRRTARASAPDYAAGSSAGACDRRYRRRFARSGNPAGHTSRCRMPHASRRRPCAQRTAQPLRPWRPNSPCAPYPRFPPCQSRRVPANTKRPQHARWRACVRNTNGTRSIAGVGSLEDCTAGTGH
jgi:hypothetical protein